jgi:hypothetical protein
MGEVNVGSYYTMVDIANEYADKELLFIANTLARQNDIIADAAYTEGNQQFSHKGAQDASLPSPGFRRFNYGVPNSTAKSRPLIEHMAILEDYAKVDYEEYRLQSQPEAWRQRKDKKHIEGMGQKLATTLFYGNLATDPAGFNGFAVRYNSSTTRPNNDSSWPYNVQLNGGTNTGYLTSIWVIEWDQDECCLLYPRGSKAGVEFEDLGKDTYESDGLSYEVLRSHFLWKCGIFVSDDRRVQRIANIETTASTQNRFDEDKIIDAILRLPSHGKDKTRCFIYSNATIAGQAWKRLKDKNNVNFSRREGLDAGGPVLEFDGIPWHLCDAIVDTESTVS